MKGQGNADYRAGYRDALEATDVAPKAGHPGYSWDCPNCGELITSYIKPPLITADALAAERRAERDRMLAMRRDYQNLPHAEFPKQWPDWKEYEDVLPTYCGCKDCRLWRSGS